MERISKINSYLHTADSILQRSTCLKKKYGAVIVKDDRIISTGYNGAPRGRKNCCDIGTCKRVEMNIPAGERYELCRSVHAEQNAIIHASYSDMQGATMYISGRDVNTDAIDFRKPCTMCERLIINAGIKTVICRINETEYEVINVNNWIKDRGD